MKETDMRLCLYCGKNLEGTSFHDGWHISCSRRFFGLKTVPALDAAPDTLESFARIAVNAGATVTGVQKKMSLHLEDEKGNKINLSRISCRIYFKAPGTGVPRFTGTRARAHEPCGDSRY